MSRIAEIAKAAEIEEAEKPPKKSLVAAQTRHGMGERWLHRQTLLM